MKINTKSILKTGLIAGNLKTPSPMRGHGFMLAQYLAKIYVDKFLGKPVPEYLKRLALKGGGAERGGV